MENSDAGITLYLVPSCSFIPLVDDDIIDEWMLEYIELNILYATTGFEAEALNYDYSASIEVSPPCNILHFQGWYIYIFNENSTLTWFLMFSNLSVWHTLWNHNTMEESSETQNWIMDYKVGPHLGEL